MRVLVFSNMRKGEPNPSARGAELVQKRWGSIESKCHPAIFEIATIYKESVEARKSLGPNPPAALIEEIELRCDARLTQIFVRHSGPVPPEPDGFAAQTVFSQASLNSLSDDYGSIELLHWDRHKIPFRFDVQKMEGKNWDASRRVQRTIADLEQLRCGKGPIQRFKFDTEHSDLFLTLWGLGIQNLTPEELADFFDRYCPCAPEAHDPSALKNQRARFRKKIDAVRLGRVKPKSVTRTDSGQRRGR